MARVIINVSEVPKRKDSDDILDSLDNIVSDDEEPVLISYHKPKKETNKDVPDDDTSETATAEWLEMIDSFHRSDIKVTRQGGSGLFDYAKSDKKTKNGKKKKKKDAMPDYEKRFEADVNYLNNILEDQTRFTQSLQKRYDTLDNGKSAARGVGKFTTDLISQINQARKTTFDIANGIVGIKKSIIDLQMKARKEFQDTNGNGEDVALESAAFMRKYLQQNISDFSSYGADAVPVEGSEEDLFRALDNELNSDPDSERDEEVDIYMKYGNNVQIQAVVDRETHEYELEAIDRRTGDIIDEYPLPSIGQLSINESTGYASDEYYQRYPIRWV